MNRLGDEIGKEYSESDFESAAYRLITDQVLYYDDRNSRVAYSLVNKFENDFSKALEPLGVQIRVNRQLRYACGLPRNGRAGAVPKALTLFALFLRKIYDELINQGCMNERGEVVCDEIELENAYRQTLQSDMPTKGEIETMMRTLKRWGLARKLDASDLPPDTTGELPFAIVIRPAIVDLLGEAAIARLARFSPTLSTDDGLTAEQATPEEDSEHDNESMEGAA